MHAENYVTINGIELFYEQYYDSQHTDTFVFIHGFLSSTFSFRRLIPYFTSRANVIAIDLPPFGKSGKLTSFVYSYENIAKTIIDFIHHLRYSPVHLVGHSMGGQIALHMMKQQPHLVKTGILLSSSGYLKRVKRSLIISSYFPFFHYYVKKFLKGTGGKGNIERVVHDHSIIDDEMIKGYEQPFLQTNDIFRALTKMLRDREGDLSTEALNKIAAPCLLIWGEYDQFVPVQTGKRLAKDLKNAHLVILKDTGHLVPEEKPAETFRHIRHFLQNHSFNPFFTGCTCDELD